MPTATTSRPPTSNDLGPSGRGRLRGIALGLATAAAALGSAELVSGLARGFASPITQVGNRVIDHVPVWLKTFAIRTFGTHDKQVLLASVYAILLIFAAIIGLLSRRHRKIALGGIALFGVVGVAASLAGVGGATAAVPSVVGGIVGVVSLHLLAGRTWGRSTEAVGVPSTVPSRRAFLGLTAAVTATGLLAGAGGRLLRTRFNAAVDRAKIILPKARKPLAPLDIAKVQVKADGITPFITPNKSFYRIDTALDVPQVAIADWKLDVSGMVDSPLSFTYDQLINRDLVEVDVTLSCVSNELGGILAGTARWLGVPLKELLDEAGVSKRSDQVVGRSVDGYTCGFPVSAATDGRTAMVAVGMNGEPLPVEHGFPARLVVAGLYGYVSATKWLTEVKLTRFDQFDQYWVPRGYADRAPIKTFSRIDTPKPLTSIPAGMHAIAGVAWAQTRGISKVEVSVDNGPWKQSTLADAPNKETWRQWMIPAQLSSGRHTITCRATDGTGATQTEQRVEPLPDGATGWHSVVVLVA